MNVMAFGSCMSNLTIAALVNQYGFKQTHSVHHNRSDNFIRYFIDRSSTMIPWEFFENLLVYKDSSERQARQFLKNQYPRYIGYHDIVHDPSSSNDFIKDLSSQKIDLILMDNFMDVAAKLMYCKAIAEYHDKPIFLNPGFYENQSEINEMFHWWGDFLTPEESAANNITIFRWLKQLQPKAKILFLTYHSCSSTGNANRFERISRFYPQLVKVANGENLLVVPPLQLPNELTKGEVDWPHFQAPVYRALAGYIYLHAVGGLPGSKHDVHCYL